MSFQDSIYTIMNADASLNAYTDAIVCKRTLNDTNEENGSIIVYDYSKNESINTVDIKDFISKWRLYIYLGTIDPNILVNASARVQEYLESYKDNNILNINYVSDNQSYDNEVKIYYNDLEFDVLYCKN